MDEIEMRANFYQKLDEGLKRPVKPRKEYLAISKQEIEERDNAIRDFIGSLEPTEKIQ